MFFYLFLHLSCHIRLVITSQKGVKEIKMILVLNMEKVRLINVILMVYIFCFDIHVLMFYPIVTTHEIMGLILIRRRRISRV